MTPFRLTAVLTAISVALAVWLLWPSATTEHAHSREPALIAGVSADSEPAQQPPPAQDTSVLAATAPQQPTSIAQLNDSLRTLEQLSATDKQKALAHARETAEIFPKTGVQAEARSAKEITLLVELNRMSEARQLVYEFIKTHPDSRYRPLVQGVTGIHPRPTGPRPP